MRRNRPSDWWAWMIWTSTCPSCWKSRARYEQDSPQADWTKVFTATKTTTDESGWRRRLLESLQTFKREATWTTWRAEIGIRFYFVAKMIAFARCLRFISLLGSRCRLHGLKFVKASACWERSSHLPRYSEALGILGDQPYEHQFANAHWVHCSLVVSAWTGHHSVDE